MESIYRIVYIYYIYGVYIYGVYISIYIYKAREKVLPYCDLRGHATNNALCTVSPRIASKHECSRSGGTARESVTSPKNILVYLDEKLSSGGNAYY